MRRIFNQETCNMRTHLDCRMSFDFGRTGMYMFGRPGNSYSCHARDRDKSVGWMRLVTFMGNGNDADKYQIYLQ